MHEIINKVQLAVVALTTKNHNTLFSEIYFKQNLKDQRSK